MPMQVVRAQVHMPNSLYLKDRVDTVDQLGQHGECFLALRRMPSLLYMYYGRIF